MYVFLDIRQMWPNIEQRRSAVRDGKYGSFCSFTDWTLAILSYHFTPRIRHCDCTRKVVGYLLSCMYTHTHAHTRTHTHCLKRNTWKFIEISILIFASIGVIPEVSGHARKRFNTDKFTSLTIHWLACTHRYTGYAAVLEPLLAIPRQFPSVLWLCWLGDRKGIRPVKKYWVLVCWW